MTRLIRSNKTLLTINLLTINTLFWAANAELAAESLEEVVVTAPAVQEPGRGEVLAGKELAVRRLWVNDSASLLSNTPGVALYTGGGISSLPAIHGMADDRVLVLVDDMPITSACANHMNPPLSYVTPTSVAKMAVIAGITPVSAGGDSIAGTIKVESAEPIFSKSSEETFSGGHIASFFRSDGNVFGVTGTATVASDRTSLNYTGSFNHGDNYHDGRGREITSTYYENQNHVGLFALRNEDNMVSLQGGIRRVPNEGFVNQQMDLVDNKEAFFNARYQGKFDWGRLEARGYWQNISHKMDVGGDKKNFPSPMYMPMNSDAENIGYVVKAEIPLSERDILRVGHEYNHYSLDDKWPPVVGTMMMAPLTFYNINNGYRDRLSVFSEWEASWNEQLTTLVGVRSDWVSMDTGDVQPYLWAKNFTGPKKMPNMNVPAANAFNAINRERSDTNFDFTVLVRYQPSQINTFEAGYARKSRSPNLYERYSWATGNMESGMINWFGDGNFYVGNPNLRPEVAHTVSLSAGWHDSARKDWEFKLTPYVTFIKDYIGVDRIKNIAYGLSTFSQLRFANHDAEIYGLDLSGKMTAWNNDTYGRGVVTGMVGWLHGQTIDGSQNNNLYHMMPINARLALAHTVDNWENRVELQLVDGKSNVDLLRNEPRTKGYGLVNVRTGYDWGQLGVYVGIDNLFDKQYNPPLAGMNFDDVLKSDWTGRIQPLTGPGRSFNVGMIGKF
ncbi:MAG: TonB-dependent receptor [Magnetococcales bacterium]|nr:TonB-dependent receptor [Magnetococcales bacterium]